MDDSSTEFLCRLPTGFPLTPLGEEEGEIKGQVNEKGAGGRGSDDACCDMDRGGGEGEGEKKRNGLRRGLLFLSASAGLKTTEWKRRGFSSSSSVVSPLSFVKEGGWGG